MTIIDYHTDICAVCGSEQKNQYLFYNLEYYPPLEQIYYKLIGAKPTQCTNCGYISWPISKKPGKVTREWLRSEEYLNNDGMIFNDHYAELYYKKYKIDLLNRRVEKALEAVFMTCLYCYIRDDLENASWCCFLALALFDKLKKPKMFDPETLKLMKAGLLRRTGQFTRLLNEYSACTFEKKMYNEYLKLLLKKAEQKDAGNIPDSELKEVLRWFEF